jgi:hypothetical protein
LNWSFWPTNDAGISDEADVDLRHRAERAHPVDLDLEAALVRGLHHALDRQPRVRRLDDGLAGVVARGAPMPLGQHHAALVRLDHDRVDDVALARRDVALRVLQLGDVDHRLRDARPELQKGHVVPELDDLPGDLLADLEPAARGRLRLREHVREGALVDDGRLRRGRRLGRRGRARAVRGRGRRSTASVVLSLAVAPRASVLSAGARGPAARRSAARRGSRTGAARALLRLRDALPERAVVLLRRWREPLLLRRLDLGARGRRLDVALADHDRTLGLGLLLLGHAGVL